jgi:hypothetical protein
VPTATPSPSAPPATVSSGTLELTIVHSNDVWGYTRPCG